MTLSRGFRSGKEVLSSPDVTACAHALIILYPPMRNQRGSLGAGGIKEVRRGFDSFIPILFFILLNHLHSDIVRYDWRTEVSLFVITLRRSW